MSAPEQAVDALSTEHLRADLKGRSVRGGALTITSQGVQFLITSAMTVVLARLLTPADFGLVAMVTAITGLAQSFADVGLSEATIQRETIDNAQVSALFWINLAVGLGLSLLTAAVGPALGWFYRQPQLVDIALVLSPTFLICGLRVQPDALLKRQMRFKALVVRDAAANVLGVATAIIMALRGAGYWAIVAYPLTYNLIQMAASWKLVKWRPSLPRRRANVRSLVVFGGNVAGSYFLNSMNHSIDKILVGWYWSAGPLGLYGKACNLLMRPLNQLTALITSVVVPAFSRLQDEPERYARYYLRTINLLVWLAAPLFGFLFVAAGPVIALMLGRQWGEAAPVFQILAVAALAQLLFDSTTWMFVSRGESARLRNLYLVMSPIIIASYAAGLPFGIKGVAISYSCVLLGTLPWVLRFAYRGTGITLGLLRQTLMCPISVALLGVLLGELAFREFEPAGILAKLFLTALAFGAAFALSAIVPQVRAEIVALTGLLREFRFAGQAA